ncbi:hypothetical protein AB1N83_004695 [Pleurotus pulmonarius]
MDAWGWDRNNGSPGETGHDGLKSRKSLRAPIRPREAEISATGASLFYNDILLPIVMFRGHLGRASAGHHIVRSKVFGMRPYLVMSSMVSTETTRQT